MVFNSMEFGRFFKVHYSTLLASFDNAFDRSHLEPAGTVLKPTGYLRYSN